MSVFKAEKALFEGYMHSKTSELGFPNVLLQPMLYSLNVGGKRLRPIIFILTANALNSNISQEVILDFALAIECIHTYSLIHDDLPAMDNDDLRRGSPTCHKKYGEAMAILAGDALLNYAYQLMIPHCKRVPTAVYALEIIAESVGTNGMLSGQALDVAYEKGIDIVPMPPTNQLLNTIHSLKTASLLSACFTSASALCDADNHTRNLLAEFGKTIGLLFQITDDLLDVEGNAVLVGKTLGKDTSKLTYPNVFGEESSKKYSQQLHQKAVSIASELVATGRFEFLPDIANFFFIRNY